MDKNIEKLLNKINNQNLTTAFIIAETNDNHITEIRIRPDSNIIIRMDGEIREVYGTYQNTDTIFSIFLKLCDNTISAYEEQINHGFITIDDGIRIGIGGKYYHDDTGKAFISDITSLNIRIPNRQYFVIPQELLIIKKGLLIAGKPHSGKTTMLKSLCKCLSQYNITICDERNELYDIRLKCDYISGISKATAIENATRALNPDIIICDEIGNYSEAQQILSAVNSGVRFICSAHSGEIQSLYNRPNIRLLLDNNIFDKIVLLSAENNNYHIMEIIDV